MPKFLVTVNEVYRVMRKVTADTPNEAETKALMREGEQICSVLETIHPRYDITPEEV